MPAPRKWTPSDLHRLRALYPGHDQKTVAELLARSFTSVRSKISALGIGDRKYWSSEGIARLRELYPDHSNQQIADLLGRSRSAINGASRVFGLKKNPEWLKANSGIQKGSNIGAAFRYPKGNVPANTGLRRPGYAPGRMAQTQFRKGGQPHNARPIGTVLADNEGYLHLKVKERAPGERGWHPAVWPCVHHLVWIEHNGPIPEGHAVIFKDGNRANCGIENLECVSRGELAARNRMWNRYPRELAMAIQLNGVLKRKLRSLDGKEQDVRSA